MQSRLPRPLLLERIITNCYAPPLWVESSENGSIGARGRRVKYIMRRWEPFHRGEATADRLINMYPHMLLMPVAARCMGVGEDYSVNVPAGTQKEDIERIIVDGIQVRTRNYVQSTELVR